MVPVDLVEATGAQVRLVRGEPTSPGSSAPRRRRARWALAEAPSTGPALCTDGRNYSLAIGPTASVAPGLCLGSPVQTVLYDRVPLGEVEVCRGDHVHATNGSIGSVQASSSTLTTT